MADEQKEIPATWTTTILKKGTLENQKTIGASIYYTAPVYKLGLTFSGDTNHVGVNSFLQRVEKLKVVRHISKKQLFDSAVDLFTDQSLIWFSVVLGTISCEIKIRFSLTKTMKEERKKEIKDASGSEIIYNDLWTFKFDKEASNNKSENDTVTVLNSPLLAVLQNLESIPFTLPIDIDSVLNDVFEDSNIFVTVKFREFAFDGMRFCDADRTEGKGIAQILCLLIMLMNVKLLEYHDDLSISFSVFKYKTEVDGPFIINSGLDDINDLGLITSYKGNHYTDYWNGTESECNKVEGYYTTYPPFMEEGSTYPIFSTDICKTIALGQTSLSEYRDISTLRFELNDKSLASDSEDCVCINRTKGLDGNNHCYHQGTLDLSTCMGAPVILSHPHLMWASEEYQNSVDGLTYEYKEGHNTVIDFEPNVGYPVNGSIRLQFNMVLRPTMFGKEEVTLTKNLPRAMLPLLWIEESFAFTDELVDELNNDLIDKINITVIVQWVLIGVGAALTVIAIPLLMCCRKK
ncbi:hypothetical protein FQA39_LY07687 [Lamprigera yunnana]|nr:hypothetical protein FQA39_LY07687 [Lamprigera yunnana]